MRNLDRLLRYAEQHVPPGISIGDQLLAATPVQIRRMKHKQYCRKTHPHLPGQTCLRCKPGWLPARERRLAEAAR